MHKLVLLGMLVSLFLVPVLAEEVAISYLGHSCFTFRAGDGPIVLVDPYDEYVPYPALPKPADIVLVTHDHVDHCAVDRVEGDPMIIWGLDDEGKAIEGEGTMQGIEIRAIPASHGMYQGKSLGECAIFIFVVGNVHFAHLADLGELLSPEQVEALSDVEVLFIPVDGVYTIDAAKAVEVIQSLPSVRVVIPMHYFVEGYCPWEDMAPVDDFIDLAKVEWTVRELGLSQVQLSAEALPDEMEVWLLDYET